MQERLSSQILHERTGDLCKVEEYFLIMETKTKRNTGGRHQAKYDRQWQRTAKNKIKHIEDHNGDKSIIEKYKINPKWKGSKRPIVKGKIGKSKRKIYDQKERS